MSQTLTGTVVSDKADKTIVVSYSFSKRHPLYHKNYSVTRKVYAHDEANKAKEGDKVVVKQAVPRSKNKKWELVEVVEESK